MTRQRAYGGVASDRSPPYNVLDGSDGVGPTGNNYGLGFGPPQTSTSQTYGENQALFNPNISYGAVTSHPFWMAKAEPLRLSKGFIVFILLSWFISFFIGYCANITFNTAFHETRRHSWEREAREEEAKQETRRHLWEREVREEEAKHEARHRLWERQAREEEAKKRATISWEGLEAGHCVRYGVKEYTATLSRVPLGLNSIQECQTKSISIHGRDWSPSRCEELAFCGRVTGHWEVDIDEPSCKPWWVNYRDKASQCLILACLSKIKPCCKGCVEYGIRRHEASIENLWDTKNWEAICMTTPNNIGGRHFDGPTTCANWCKGCLWPWGIWLVEDDSCR